MSSPMGACVRTDGRFARPPVALRAEGDAWAHIARHARRLPEDMKPLIVGRHAA